MNLEDTLGDILRKARTSTQTSPEAAAAAAGLSVEVYAEFERTGNPPPGTRFVPLGDLLTLSGARLEAQSRGWRPLPVDLSRWQRLEVITTAGEDMTVNAFLIWDPATRQAALFDTGFTAGPIQERIRAEGLQLEYLFITHSHYDHVMALGELRRLNPAVRVWSGSTQVPVDQRLVPDSQFDLGSLRVSHRPTPGHAVDGVTYRITGWAGGAPPVVVGGDAGFAGAIGGARDQLPLARDRVRGEIFGQPEATLVCPGHGPLTTVGQEKANNPWFT